ncbi:MAG: hypothetical protein LBD88_02715 [Candidatus Peribacteria bacterium]|jgi:hypothetical protein|nr:hypothetical protein [Candidatus Peribacteria bacterium]
MIDPFSSITSALSKADKYTLNTFQINFVPIQDKTWKENSERVLKILKSKYPEFLKNFLLSKYYIILKILSFPITALAWTIKLFWRKEEEEIKEVIEEDQKKDINKNILNKLSLSGYEVSINIIHA